MNMVDDIVTTKRIPANDRVPGGTREDVMVPVDPDTRPEKRENFLTSLNCKSPAKSSTIESGQNQTNKVNEQLVK
jgi:hypothetical protein